MERKYELDLSKIKLMKYYEFLNNKHFLPSRISLKNNLLANFEYFKQHNITNIAQLVKSLKDEHFIIETATNSLMTAEYLKLLKREVNSLRIKPLKLSEFKYLNLKIIEKLASIGIINSKQYWLQEDQESTELASLCDLVRINGVKATAAKLFYEANYRSVLAISQANAQELLVKIQEINNDQQYYQGNLHLKDLEYCINYAKLIINQEALK